MNREHLVDFVRRCWERITSYLPPEKSAFTVVDEFAARADQPSGLDAALYADEAALKAARWAPAFGEERRQQAALLRQTFPHPF